MAIGLYRITFRGSLSADYRENVMHLRLDPEPSANPYDTANSIVGVLHSTFKTLWLAMLPQDYYLESIFAQRLGPTMGPYAANDYEPFNQMGTRGAQSASLQLCPCVTLIPPMGVKSGGRVFLPAVAKADYSNNVPAAGFVTAVSNFFTPMISGFSVAGGTATLAIFSRKLNTSSNVSTFHLSAAVGYQRNRAKPYL